MLPVKVVNSVSILLPLAQKANQYMLHVRKIPVIERIELVNRAGHSKNGTRIQRGQTLLTRLLDGGKFIVHIHRVGVYLPIFLFTLD